ADAAACIDLPHTATAGKTIPDVLAAGRQLASLERQIRACAVFVSTTRNMTRVRHQNVHQNAAAGRAPKTVRLTKMLLPVGSRLEIGSNTPCIWRRVAKPNTPPKPRRAILPRCVLAKCATPPSSPATLSTSSVTAPEPKVAWPVLCDLDNVTLYCAAQLTTPTPTSALWSLMPTLWSLL